MKMPIAKVQQKVIAGYYLHGFLRTCLNAQTKQCRPDQCRRRRIYTKNKLWRCRKERKSKSKPTHIIHRLPQSRNLRISHRYRNGNCHDDQSRYDIFERFFFSYALTVCANLIFICYYLLLYLFLCSDYILLRLCMTTDIFFHFLYSR